jgi:Flp pilus assembly protein TadG
MAPTPLVRDRECGQTIVLITVFMLSLLGAAALAIDVGNLYSNKRQVQAAADAAALAGASQLGVSTAAAQAAASATYAKNGNGSDSVTVTIVTKSTANDSVQVSATRSAPTFFAKVFGWSSANVTASAQASIESYTTYASSGNLMPWGVMKGNYVSGNSYTIYGDGSSSNNGALSIDIKSGASCASANGANDYRNTIDGSSTGCPVSVGQLVDTKTGNNTGPTAQGLNNRVSSWKTFNQIVQLNANGQYTVLDATSPQLVMVPIVLNTNNSTVWPNGSSQVKIVGFAWFVITGCGSPSKQGSCSNSDGKDVNGTFVGLQNVDPTQTPGAWDPSGSTASTIELTG